MKASTFVAIGMIALLAVIQSKINDAEGRGYRGVGFISASEGMGHYWTEQGDYYRSPSWSSTPYTFIGNVFAEASIPGSIIVSADADVAVTDAGALVNCSSGGVFTYYGDVTEGGVRTGDSSVSGVKSKFGND